MLLLQSPAAAAKRIATATAASVRASGRHRRPRFLLPQPHGLQQKAGNATVAGPRPLAPSTFSRYVSEPRCVRVVGAPLADGQSLLGVDRGPTFIRKHGLVERLVRAHPMDVWLAH